MKKYILLLLVLCSSANAARLAIQYNTPGLSVNYVRHEPVWQLTPIPRPYYHYHRPIPRPYYTPYYRPHIDGYRPYDGYNRYERAPSTEPTWIQPN